MTNYGERSHDEGDISTPFLRLSVNVFLFKYLTQCHCYFDRLTWRYVITSTLKRHRHYHIWQTVQTCIFAQVPSLSMYLILTFINSYCRTCFLRWSVNFGVISVTRGWVGVQFPGKKRYVTLEWPLSAKYQIGAIHTADTMWCFFTVVGRTLCTPAARVRVPGIIRVSLISKSPRIAVGSTAVRIIRYVRRLLCA